MTEAVPLQFVPALVTLPLMSVTGAVGEENEAKLRQVERLVASDVLHGSESLCKLLRYLAEQSIGHPGTGVKEYQIATEVFKRPEDFDPRMDSTVRVQTGRLRSKLAEYYAQAGAEDHWVVDIPKGAYTLNFHVRQAAPAPDPNSTPTPAAETAAPVRPPETSHKRWLVTVAAMSVLLAICVVAIVVLVVDRPKIQSAARTASHGALSTFWGRFVDTPDEPLVIFSNAAFVGRPETGMHYFNSKIDKPQPIHDHYTGVGEVLGMHELDQVFASLNHRLRVKRGRLLSMDDAKNNDLIFMGSPSENLSLLEIPTTQDFIFKREEEGPRKGDLTIVNVHPRPNEQKIYISTAQLPLTEDYAVVGLMPGLNPSRWMLLLAGLTTLGTQAAVEYVSRANTVEELLKQIAGAAGSPVAPFEAVLQVKVSGGVPVHSQLVAFRLRK